MNNEVLITDEIVAEFAEAYHNSGGDIEMSLCAVVDDITRPVFNILNGYKQTAKAYEDALKNIRAIGEPLSSIQADAALKGDYHEPQQPSEASNRQRG